MTDKRDLRKSLIEALNELKLMREGKIPKKTWREMMREIKEEVDSD